MNASGAGQNWRQLLSLPMAEQKVFDRVARAEKDVYEKGKLRGK